MSGRRKVLTRCKLVSSGWIVAFTDGSPVSMGVDGSFTPRSSMSLANLLWVRNFFWYGRSQGLEEQAAFPLTDSTFITNPAFSNPHSISKSQ